MPTFTATPSNWTNASSDANFRAWGEYISDQMTAVGLLKTADTGQIDWTSVTNPGAVNTFVGYEIRAFADTLQSTAPVYFKIEYGEGGATDTPAITLQFGTGSDGSGSLTGTTSTLVRNVAASTASSVTVLGSGANNRFIFTEDLVSGMFFGFERTKDASGADTSEGIIVILSGTTVTGNGGASSGSARTLYWNPSTGTVVDTATGGKVAALFPYTATWVYGAQTGVAPIFGEKPIFTNPILNVVGVFTEDIAATNTFSAYMYGTAHQYRVTLTGSGITSSGFRGPGGGTEQAAIRYE